MNITPFSSSRMGARVAPAVAAANGEFEVGITGTHKKSNFPTADQVVSCSFYPTVWPQGSGLGTALMEVCMNMATTEAMTPHSYFQAREGGWNLTGLNTDGVAVVARQPVALGLYNATNYTFSWEISGSKLLHDTDPTLGTPYNHTCVMSLPPGAHVVLSSPDVGHVYYEASTYYYGVTGGLCPINSYLHVVLSSFGAGNPKGYGYTGNLEVVIFGKPIV